MVVEAIGAWCSTLYKSGFWRNDQHRTIWCLPVALPGDSADGQAKLPWGAGSSDMFGGCYSIAV